VSVRGYRKLVTWRSIYI